MAAPPCSHLRRPPTAPSLAAGPRPQQRGAEGPGGGDGPQLPQRGCRHLHRHHPPAGRLRCSGQALWRAQGRGGHQTAAMGILPLAPRQTPSHHLPRHRWPRHLLNHQVLCLQRSAGCQQLRQRRPGTPLPPRYQCPSRHAPPHCTHPSSRWQGPPPPSTSSSSQGSGPCCGAACRGVRGRVQAASQAPRAPTSMPLPSPSGICGGCRTRVAHAGQGLRRLGGDDQARPGRDTVNEGPLWGLGQAAIGLQIAMPPASRHAVLPHLWISAVRLLAQPVDVRICSSCPTACPAPLSCRADKDPSSGSHCSLLCAACSGLRAPACIGPRWPGPSPAGRSWAPPGRCWRCAARQPAQWAGRPYPTPSSAWQRRPPPCCGRPCSGCRATARRRLGRRTRRCGCAGSGACSRSSTCAAQRAP